MLERGSLVFDKSLKIFRQVVEFKASGHLITKTWLTNESNRYVYDKSAMCAFLKREPDWVIFLDKRERIAEVLAGPETLEKAALWLDIYAENFWRTLVRIIADAFNIIVKAIKRFWDTLVEFRRVVWIALALLLLLIWLEGG